MHYPDEQQILSLLRELMAENGMTAEDLENDLGWQPGRLSGALAGQKSIPLRDLFAILSLLEVGATEFFSRAYSLEPGKPALLSIEQVTRERFEESQRVIQDAVTRRFTWKRERMES
jgi:transcriptional regulator with XRE-family HTH domain